MKKTVATALALIFLVSVTAYATGSKPKNNPDNATLIDDWQYSPPVEDESFTTKVFSMMPAATAPRVAMEAAAPRAPIGLATGGAKDIGNFRENIANGYLPQPSDITYEGIFYDYRFDPGEQKPCADLFCPTYSAALSPDPFSGKDATYLSVGLASGMEAGDFGRKKLNLVVVLDISGSMSSSFREYYYDRFGNRQKAETGSDDRTKMQIATQSVANMLDQLRPGDQLGIVLFDNSAYLAKPLSPVEKTDIRAIQGHVLEVKPEGGTNMYSGISMASKMFDTVQNADQNEYENRIIFLTDAMPNTGPVDGESLFSLTSTNAARKIYTTFIGIGVDFNTRLIEIISKIRGSNYYSVHSAKAFEKRLNDEFEFMVTPLVFDLKLALSSPDYEIERVYGSPEADISTGELLRVNTLFPSSTDDNGTRGGIILLKLRKKAGISLDSAKNIVLRASWQDRAGKAGTSETMVNLDGMKSGTYPNTGIRKGILLARYADMLKSWLMEQNVHSATATRPIICPDWAKLGIMPDPALCKRLGEWERMSSELDVMPAYRALFEKATPWFAAETQALGDATLERELGVLDLLSAKR